MGCIMRKPDFCIYENKSADHLSGNRTAHWRLCFRYTDSRSLCPKFQSTYYLLWLYSPVCVVPGQNPGVARKLFIAMFQISKQFKSHSASTKNQQKNLLFCFNSFTKRHQIWRQNNLFQCSIRSDLWTEISTNSNLIQLAQNRHITWHIYIYIYIASYYKEK